VFYEDVMRGWQAELRRLARFVGAPELAQEDVTQSTVREFCEGELQHHRTSVLDAAADGTLPFPAKSLYVALRLYAELDRDGVSHRSMSEATLGDCVNRLGLYAVAAQTEVDAAEVRISALERHVRAIQTRTGCLGLAARLFLGAHAHELGRWIYRGGRWPIKAPRCCSRAGFSPAKPTTSSSSGGVR
jgi:hypothetical protein